MSELTEAQADEVVEIAQRVGRDVAREEVASLVGLVLRRTQDRVLTRSAEHNLADDTVRETLASIFGEALRDFTSEAEPGPAQLEP